MEFENIEKLPVSVRKLLQSYCAKTKELHGENLVSLIVYGSALGGDFIPGKSNVNLLIALNRIDPPDLKKSVRLVSSGQRKGIIPLMLTFQHIKTSTDVFPIEFSEMKENHLLIYGKDILTELSINPQNIRRQCEQQIKGGLIRLYQIYLETELKPKRMMTLLENSLVSLIPIFRNLLKLKQAPYSFGKEDVINKLGDKFNVDKEIFLKIWRIKQGKEKPENIEELWGDYLEEIEKLGIIVDQLEV